MTRTVGILFVALGAALLVGAVRSGVATLRFVRGAARAPGLVVRLNAGGSHPQVEFRAQGRTFSFPQNGIIFGYELGDRVEVLYDPEAPAKRACVDVLGALWFAPAMLVVLGIAAVACGLLAVVRSRSVAVVPA